MQETGNYDLDLANKYQLTTNKVIEAINSDFYDLIIVDYQIVDGNKQRTAENIKTALTNLDKNLTQLYNAIIAKNGLMYITSGYGINEALYNNKEELVNINFSKKVPFLIVDNDISKDTYSLSSGELSDLSTTIINSLEIQPMQGMTGKNLLIHRTISKSKKKKQNKMLITLLVIVIIIVAAVVALMYLGLI